MSLVTALWAMIAGACLTLAAFHLPAWWQDRNATTSLAFALAAVCTAVLAFIELVMIHAQKPAAYLAALKWANVPGALLPMSLFSLAVLGVMGWVMSLDRARAKRAARELHEREQREMLRLRQEIAHVGRVSVMGQLASALAHEINQPLGAILRNAEAAALFMQDPSPDLAEISAIVDDIRKDDQRASAVIDRMRALLRRQAVDRVPIDVAQVLGDVATLLRPDAAARHVKLELHVPGDVPPVLGDRVQLQQVLLNLVLNGMEALEGMHDGPRRVRVSAQRTVAQAVQVCVSDTGRGIAAADLEHIFDPFFSTKPEGLGIGLSISRSIVESHRGRLWAENDADGGARFCFTLPAAG